MTIIAQPKPSTKPTTGAAIQLESAWQYALSQLKHQVGAGAFTAYLRDSWAVALQDGLLQIATPDELARDWCNSRLTTIVSRHLAALIGQPLQVQFIFEPGAPPSGELHLPTNPQSSAAHPGAMHLPDSPQPSTISHNESVVQSEQNFLDDIDDNERLILENVSDTIETALVRPARIIAFPRYELRFIPLVGPENFFIRLAFLQERFLHTRDDGRDQPFETSVESLLRWANVGRATLHRFKKGDSGRGQMPAAGWFGIEQLPSPGRSSVSQQQPPCRYKLQAGIPLTPIDAGRLLEQLIEAGIQQDPLQALKTLCERPLNEILQFPAPVGGALGTGGALRECAPTFNTVSSVVKAALEGARFSATLKADIETLIARLSDHITMPHQMVHVSWYFLQEWLPILGHDAAAMVLYARAQGFYNPQTNEVRDQVNIAGGYSELARVIGLKRDRTIGDWLPNLFESRARDKDAAHWVQAPPVLSAPPVPSAPPGADKWEREQQRLAQTQHNIGLFMQVVPGSRTKTLAGHFAFSLRVEIKSEPLTPADQVLRTWVQTTLACCAEEQVTGHFLAWVKSEAFETLARSAQCSNDGAGTLSGTTAAQNNNDGWGILGASHEYQRQHTVTQMTARESRKLASDGWGILEEILIDSSGILGSAQMTAGELFKGLLRLTTFWETILTKYQTTQQQIYPQPVVVGQWDLTSICRRNGGMNAYRETILAQNNASLRFISWLFYAYGSKGRGILDPVGWALARVKDQPELFAEGACYRLAVAPPEKIAALLRRHIESGMAPSDADWALAFHDAQLSRLRELEDVLGLRPKPASKEALSVLDNPYRQR